MIRQRAAISLASAWLWPFLYLVLAAPVGIFMALAIPLGHSPDERAHALRAESLLHGGWIGLRGVQDGNLVSGVWADPAIAYVVRLPERPLESEMEPVTAAMRAEAENMGWSAPGFVRADAIAGYMPIFYMPGALAVAGARLLGAGPAMAFRAIRLTNLTCFVLLGMLALRVAPKGRALIACGLLLPMSLSLAASCSQDGLLIACSALAAASALRAPSVRSPWFVVEALLLALVIAGKQPYAPLLLLLLLPLRGGGKLLLRAAVMLLVVAPSLAWTYVELTRVAVPVVRAAAEAGPLWPGTRPALFAGPDFSAQARVLFAAPWNILILPWRTLRGNGGQLLMQFVGVLDYLCLPLPKLLYRAWFVALAASVVATMAEPETAKFRAQDRMLALAGCLGCAIAVAMALYVQWTPVGMMWIAGIQGRYFLPLLFPAALMLPRIPLPLFSRTMSVLPLLAAAADIFWLPPLIRAFYPTLE